MLNNTQKFYFLLLIFCLAMLTSSFILQYGIGLEPCPLCILSRIAVMLLTALIILILLINPQKKLLKTISSLSCSLIAFSGLAISCRHVFLQHLPKDAVPDCGPGFDYIIESFPLQDALTMILTGSGHCAEVSLVVFGLSLAEWTLISFAATFLISLIPLFKKFDA